jgi:hypothetical protein
MVTMLAAVIDARSNPMALAATLGPLVRGVVEGIIGRAIVVNPVEDADIVAIADNAGCRLLVEPGWTEGFARAITNSSGAGILLIDAGLQVAPDFWPLLADRLPVLGNRPAATPPATGGRLMAALAAQFLTFGGRVNRDSALLLPPGRAREIGLAKLDPYGVRYGGDLVRLESTVTRVALG